MSDKGKHVIKTSIWLIITFILLELLLLSAIVTLMTVAEFRLEITTDILLENLKNMFTHLPNTIKTFWQDKNPLFLLGTIAVFIYSLVAHKKSFKKSGWDTEVDNAYHGSAHWAKEHEIFDKKNFLKATKKNIQSDFIQSLKERDV